MSHLASLPEIILDTIFKATVLFALVWTVCGLLKRRSAAARHMVRTLFMTGLLLLPFSSVLPGWHVRGLPQFVSASAVAPPSPAEPAHVWPTTYASDPPIATATAPRG